jgi:hypothetical protein
MVKKCRVPQWHCGRGMINIGKSLKAWAIFCHRAIVYFDKFFITEVAQILGKYFLIKFVIS